jgi:hypothetical protein
MAQIDNIEQSFIVMNETLDRIEARVDEMNRMLSEIVAEIEKHKQPRVFENDGEVMFRNKRWAELKSYTHTNKQSKDNDSDESMYDINRSI